MYGHCPSAEMNVVIHVVDCMRQRHLLFMEWFVYKINKLETSCKQNAIVTNIYIPKE